MLCITIVVFEEQYGHVWENRIVYDIIQKFLGFTNRMVGVSVFPLRLQSTCNYIEQHVVQLLAIAAQPIYDITLPHVLAGPESFDILRGHSRATVFLICNNAAQGILSSFFFKYAGNG